MTDVQQRAAAKKFVETWTDRGDEKQETQSFWIDLLQNVLGVENPTDYIKFEVKVKLDHTSFIDGLIEKTRVLIEQKGKDIVLKNASKQSDGTMLTPFQQARRYAGNLPHNQNPRWIVTCNFKQFNVYDMNRPNDEPEIIYLKDLEKEYYRLNFLVDTGSEHIKKEMEISLKAGELVGALYDSILKQYKNPNDPETLKSLNKLCVRIVFCLYAEDAEIFGVHGKFYDYLHRFSARDVRRALKDLFLVLNTKPENRDPYLDDELASFPYVNGGLFEDENIEIPNFTDDIVKLLLEDASANFDWSEISPTIFGAVFESTLNPETRRSGGMHYTSIENIHKVIDPLFLDELKDELEEIRQIKVDKTRNSRLREFQKKLSSLTFLDPACGSGNFLTETYISLRRMENEAIAMLEYNQVILAGHINPIQVSISQFYGIEINDFAVTVAKTALWIAESQMMKETEDIVSMQLGFLPLKTNAYIVEGNALRLNWGEVVPKDKLNYIMGNPPFVGKKEQSKEQKNELISIYGKKVKGIGNLDYVTGWYMKAAKIMENLQIKTAFVSTNSITQGEQVPIFWREMLNIGIHIDFAYRTFRWDSEAKLKAHVHCVIIGFSFCKLQEKRIYFGENQKVIAQNINPYLVDAPSVLIENRTKPICKVPTISYGSMPIDNGNLIIDKDDLQVLLNENKDNIRFVRKYAGGAELIRGKERWCLWLQDFSPKEIKTSKFVFDRVKKTAEFRRNSKRPQTLALSDVPYLFGEIRQPKTDMLVIPKVSSERRKYIPISYINPEVIINGSALIVADATLYNFGVLTSNVHMAWMRAVCGRMKSDYQYSGNIVYNNFPWCSPTPAQKAKIEKTAQQILDARALYPDSSLADLYDESIMPYELRKAHQNNDRAVMEAYGFPVKSMTESDCVAELMKMYQKLTEN